MTVVSRMKLTTVMCHGKIFLSPDIETQLRMGVYLVLELSEFPFSTV